MPGLIKAQAVTDTGVRLAVRQEAALRGAEPACSENCAGCCASGRTAATAVEVAGALWYLGHGASPFSDQASQRFISRDLDQGCPFLIEGSCAVYPMRFLSCRQLVVFGRACSQGEDPVRSRRADLLTPLRLHAFKSYSLLLPFLGVSLAPSDPYELETLLARLLKPVSAYQDLEPAALLASLEHVRAVEARKAA